MWRMRWKNWPWLERGVVPLVGVLVRVAGLAPIVRLVLNGILVFPRDVRYPVWLLAGVLLLAGLVRQGAPATRRGRAIASLGGLMVMVASLLGVLRLAPWQVGAWLPGLWEAMNTFEQGFPAAWVVLGVTGMAWLWGLRTPWRDYDALARDVAAGSLVLAVAILTCSPDTLHTAGIDAGRALTTFAATAVPGLAIVSAFRTQVLERLRRGGAPRLSVKWLAALLVVLGLSLVGGWLISWALAPTHVAAAGQEVGTLRAALVERLLPATERLAYVLFRAFYIPIGAFHRLMQSWGPGARQSAGPAQVPVADGHADGPILRMVRWMASGLFWGLLAYAFWRALHRRARRLPALAVDEHASLFGAELFLEQVRELWRGLRRRRRRGLFGGILEADAARRAIRRAYRRLLALCAQRGYRRRPWLTPYGYLRHLGRTLAVDEASLTTLTDAYVTARYGRDELSPGMVSAAHDALEALERDLAQRRDGRPALTLRRGTGHRPPPGVRLP